MPATVAVLGGRVHVGLAPDQLEALARAGPMARKCSSRDLGVAIAQVSPLVHVIVLGEYQAGYR